MTSNPPGVAFRYLSQGLKNNKLSPSLLFVGEANSDRLFAAIELVKCFSCQSPEPQTTNEGLPRCGLCSACERVEANNHPDLLIINRTSQATIIKEKAETQTAIKIESVRYLDKFLRLRPSESQRRCVVIEEADKMTLEAANALLKILEEPPANTQIVLITKDIKAFPPTIASRCAIVRFPSRPHQASSEVEPLDIEDYELDEFFELVSNTNWRREGRKQAEDALRRILLPIQKKWEAGDLSQERRIKAILAARRQIDRNVTPKLVLENLYMELQSS